MNDVFEIRGAGDDLSWSMQQRAAKILIRANTLAGHAVDVSRDSELTPDDPTMICVYTPVVSRAWAGGDPPTFLAKVPLIIAGKVTAKIKDQANELVNILRVQIENALLTAPEFWTAPLEKVNSIETSVELPGDAERHEGYITMVLECECTDVFMPAHRLRPLTEIQITVPNLTMPPDETNPDNNLIGAIAELNQGAC